VRDLCKTPPFAQFLRLAEAMLMHEEEFFNEFEFADVLHF